MNIAKYMGMGSMQELDGSTRVQAFPRMKTSAKYLPVTCFHAIVVELSSLPRRIVCQLYQITQNLNCAYESEQIKIAMALLKLIACRLCLLGPLVHKS